MAHVDAVLIERELAITDLEHVGIIPVSGPAYLARPACERPMERMRSKLG